MIDFSAAYRLAFSALVAAGLVSAPGSAQSQAGDPNQAPAERIQTDLELVLLADASGSIDNAEIQFQRQGYADALADPELISAMTGGFRGSVALTYVEWGDRNAQDVVVGWTVIDGPAAARRFSDALLAAPRRAFGYNSIGAALLKAVDLIETNAIDGDRRVIDFSADSDRNSNGPSIAEGRAAAIDRGITINGLAILCRVCSGRPVSYNLEQAFEDKIIGGLGAFVITADSRETFAEAVRQKLYLEVSGLTPEMERAEVSAPR